MPCNDHRQTGHLTMEQGLLDGKEWEFNRSEPLFMRKILGKFLLIWDVSSATFLALFMRPEI